jgi:hypothetical protein
MRSSSRTSALTHHENRPRRRSLPSDRTPAGVGCQSISTSARTQRPRRSQGLTPVWTGVSCARYGSSRASSRSACGTSGEFFFPSFNGNTDKSLFQERVRPGWLGLARSRCVCARDGEDRRRAASRASARSCWCWLRRERTHAATGTSPPDSPLSSYANYRVTIVRPPAVAVAYTCSSERIAAVKPIANHHGGLVQQSIVAINRRRH